MAARLTRKTVAQGCAACPVELGAAPLSDMALSAVIRRMNENRPEGAPAPWRDADGREAVPHGFRATFRTWVDDTRPIEAEAAERALAHEEPNKVAGAYRRSDPFDRRLPLMVAWAEHCAAGSQPVTTPSRIPSRRTDGAAGA